MVCCLNRPEAQQFFSSEYSRGEIASYADGTKKQLCSCSCACVCKTARVNMTQATFPQGRCNVF